MRSMWGLVDVLVVLALFALLQGCAADVANEPAAPSCEGLDHGARDVSEQFAVQLGVVEQAAEDLGYGAATGADDVPVYRLPDALLNPACGYPASASIGGCAQFDGCQLRIYLAEEGSGHGSGWRLAVHEYAHVVLGNMGVPTFDHNAAFLAVDAHAVELLGW